MAQRLSAAQALQFLFAVLPSEVNGFDFSRSFEDLP
jgi:hypothetical protein